MNKRTRGIDLDGLNTLLEQEPKEYEAAWHTLKDFIFAATDDTSDEEHIPCLAASSLYIGEVKEIFNLQTSKDILWSDLPASPVYQHILDSISKIISLTMHGHRPRDEGLSRMVMDQILTSALYEEKIQSTSKDTAVLPEVRHDVHFKRRVV
ncbi:MAG: hypothetical protein Q9213_002266 [Squamulea squamosa]